MLQVLWSGPILRLVLYCILTLIPRNESEILKFMTSNKKFSPDHRLPNPTRPVEVSHCAYYDILRIKASTTLLLTITQVPFSGIRD